MVEADKKAFATAIGALLVTFGQEATQPRLHGYWIGLRDLELVQVEEAVTRAIASCSRVPLPFDLRKLIGMVVDDDHRVNLAWDDVQRAMRLGPYKHVDFQDKIINATIRNLGGWVTFLDRFSDSEAEKWVRIDFAKVYKSYARSGVSGDAIRPLTGLNEAEVHNGVVGPPLPRLVACDPDRAEAPKLIDYRPCPLPEVTQAVSRLDFQDGSTERRQTVEQRGSSHIAERLNQIY